MPQLLKYLIFFSLVLDNYKSKLAPKYFVICLFALFMPFDL